MGDEKRGPGRPRRKHYNLRTCREELIEMFPQSEYQRMRVLNLIERIAGYWFEAAGGDAEEFDEWFNRVTK